MSYNIKKIQKDIHRAERMSADRKTKISFELEEFEDGWIVESKYYNVEHPFPEKNRMFLPNEVIEQILLIETSKKELKE